MDKYDNFIGLMGSRISNLSRKKGRLYFEVSSENLLSVAEYLFKELGCRLSTATGLEVHRGIMVIYHFSHDETGNYYCPKAISTDKENPVIPSITPIIRGAEWIEREISEMFGVDFTGHPRKEKLLTGNHPGKLRYPLRLGRLK